MSEKIKNILARELKGKLNHKEIECLPSGFQRIGDIIIIKIDRRLSGFESAIGNIILNNVPQIRTVCKIMGNISGEKRLPKIKIIAGEKSTETIHKENGCFFSLDVSKIMFSKGNLNERGRLSRKINKNETVVDMFSGIGYFSIPIAKFSRPKKIHSIDINPKSIHYLKKNIKLNKVERIIQPHLGDCREIVKTIGKNADRIIMGYFPNTKEFLDAAFFVLKEEGGVIHFHDKYHENELWNKPIEILEKYAQKNGYKLEKIIEKIKVKSYAPGIYHIVIDAKFVKR
jgi:tRNA wybutosine-synthesizing protein 2